MNPYMFVFEAVPEETNERCKEIAGALVHVWVMSDSMEAAKIIATANIKSYHWDVKGIEHEFVIQPEQISRLHKREAALYHLALKNGIASEYIAHPKVPRPDNVVGIQRLER